MNKAICILLIVVFWSLPSFSRSDIKALESRAVERMKLRKKSYQSYKKEKIRKDKVRRAKSDRQKILRAKYEQKMDRARRKFKRVDKKIPISAYREFRKLRDRQAMKIENARQEYRDLKKVLGNIHEKSRYKINKMEEYKL